MACRLRWVIVAILLQQIHLGNQPGKVLLLENRWLATSYRHFERLAKDLVSTVTVITLSLGSSMDASCAEKYSHLSNYSSIIWPVNFIQARDLCPVPFLENSSPCIAHSEISTSAMGPFHTAWCTQTAPHQTLVGLSRMLNPSNTRQHLIYWILSCSHALDVTKTNLPQHRPALHPKHTLLSESPSSAPNSTGSSPVVLETYDWTAFGPSSSHSLPNDASAKCSSRT